MKSGPPCFCCILTACYSLVSKLMDTRWSSHRDGYRIGDCRLKPKADKFSISSYFLETYLYVPSRFAICSSLDSQAICSETKASAIMVRPTLMTSFTLLVRLLEVFFATVCTAGKMKFLQFCVLAPFQTLRNTRTKWHRSIVTRSLQLIPIPSLTETQSGLLVNISDSDTKY